MEPIQSNPSARTSAKDFFLHLGAMVGLYTIVISFLNLVFTIINKAFPEVNNYYVYLRSGSEISLPVATLLIVFPIFIVLSYFVQKTYTQSPEKKDLPIRKWLTYITLFISGIILAGDLVTVLYKFLDGQDLTLGFLLKALSVLLVSALVFGYYLNDIRERIPSSRRKFWVIVSGVVILVFIIIGFSVIGSPRSQRLYRYDDRKISDLQNIQWQVISHWQTYGSIPNTIQELSNSSSINYYNIPKDPETGENYGYTKTSDLSFEICATFNKANKTNKAENLQIMPMYIEKTGMNENWQHEKGRECFSRTIDPLLYPTRIKG